MITGIITSFLILLLAIAMLAYFADRRNQKADQQQKPARPATNYLEESRKLLEKNQEALDQIQKNSDTIEKLTQKLLKQQEAENV